MCRSAIVMVVGATVGAGRHAQGASATRAVSTTASPGAPAAEGVGAHVWVGRLPGAEPSKPLLDPFPTSLPSSDPYPVRARTQGESSAPRRCRFLPQDACRRSPAHPVSPGGRCRSISRLRASRCHRRGGPTRPPDESSPRTKRVGPSRQEVTSTASPEHLPHPHRRPRDGGTR